jgi:hypothetical protein
LSYQAKINSCAGRITGFAQEALETPIWEPLHSKVVEAASSEPAGQRLIQRLADQSNAKQWLLGLVEQFHAPLGTLLQASRDPAEQI